MNIWIFNHYATNMYFDGAGRHHSLAKYLIKNGHEVTIFCANERHNGGTVIDIKGNAYVQMTGEDNVKYVFVKTSKYTGNGLGRMQNMVEFYRNIKTVAKIVNKENLSPDIIVASSVHPLTLLAGIQIAKKLHIPCICEVRDLWPETFVELGLISRSNPITKVLYKGEKYIYKKADALIFTMPGGEKYIRDKGWQKDIELEKVYHINNGVDLQKYEEDKKTYTLNDDDLEDDIFKIIYAGSIRKANKVEKLVELATILEEKRIENVKILVYGDGDQREKLYGLAREKGLKNIVFKGRVEKKYVPYILSKGTLNVAIDEANELGQYGISWNKIFEYMASGKPVLIDYDLGNYNIVDKYGFGIAKEHEDIQSFCDALLNMINISKEQYENYSANAQIAAKEYDYKRLAEQLNNIISITIGRVKR